MNGYMTVQETASKWGISERQVQYLCKTQRVPGATKLSRIWVIPQEAENPSLFHLESMIGDTRVNLSGAPWTMLEFFAGSGMVAYGLKDMFQPVWANDNSTRKAAVYRANFYPEHLQVTDIRNISGRELPSVHLSWASFPCQDLSLAGKQHGIHAERSGLVWEWLRILDEMEFPPRLLALENVNGLLSGNDGENYRELHKALQVRGYRAGAVCMNAAHFLPQSRPRVFVIAVKKDVVFPKALVSDGPCWLHNAAARKIGKGLEDWVWWHAEEPPRPNIRIEDILEKDIAFDKDDVLRLLSPRAMDELNRHSHMVATGYRRTRNKKQVLELRFDGIAGCLRTPGGGSSKQYVVVRDGGVNHARLLTVREAARLMGAPDTFVLPGSYNDGYLAMGDAVVRPVIQFLGEHFLLPLSEAAYHA